VDNFFLVYPSFPAVIPEFVCRLTVKSQATASYVRGEQKRNSDIDILVEFCQGTFPTLFSFVALEQELTDLLGVKVDLVEKRTLKPGLRNRILHEAVPI